MISMTRLGGKDRLAGGYGSGVAILEGQERFEGI